MSRSYLNCTIDIVFFKYYTMQRYNILKGCFFVKNFGNLLRILAIVFLCIALITSIVDYSNSSESITESQKELDEDVEEHNDDIEELEDNDEDYEHDSEDCSVCENLEDRQKSLDRSSTSILMGTIQEILTYAIFCSILFAVSEIVRKSNSTTEFEQPQAPVTNCCPNCGNVLKPDDRFCGVCGSVTRN